MQNRGAGQLSGKTVGTGLRIVREHWQNPNVTIRSVVLIWVWRGVPLPSPAEKVARPKGVTDEESELSVSYWSCTRSNERNTST